MRTTIAFCAALILSATIGVGQSSPQPKGMKLEVANEDVRVWRLTKLPHKPSPSHYTPPAVFVFLNDTRMRWTFPNKPPLEESYSSGTVKWWAGGVHISENIGEAPIEMLIVVPLSTLPKDAPEK